MNVLVTGAKGFIGRNLVAWLEHQDDIEIMGFDIDNTPDELNAWLDEADFVFHLAGVNRPRNEEEFFSGNAGLTSTICERLAQREDPPPILLSSSIQAELDNPYGRSKRLAEEVVARYGEQTGARTIIYRLTNVFGKWSRPNYNTVVATFCYNIAHDLPITITDPDREIDLIHVDDVVRAFISEVRSQKSEDRDQRSEVRGQRTEVRSQEVRPSYRVTLGRLAELIRSFRESRKSLVVPDLSDPFVRKLYGMYLSYLDEDDFAYGLTQRCDDRGCLAEFVKSEPFGQIFVSRTKPGITRGNHYHHTKTEKFLVLEGDAIIRFRHIGGQRSGVRDQKSEIRTPSHATRGSGGGSGRGPLEGRSQRSDGRTVIEYRVSGKDFRVLDIPTGYTHSIENVGDSELVTLFWASEVFDPERMDTVWEEV